MGLLDESFQEWMRRTNPLLLLTMNNLSVSTESQTGSQTSGGSLVTGNNLLLGTGINILGNQFSGYLSNNLFGNSEMGRVFGTLMGSATNTATNTLTDNLLKGTSLTLGLSQNMGSSLAGAGAGIASNYIGKGITSAMGNSNVGKAVGAGVSTALGTIGGLVAGNLAKGMKIGSLFGKAAGSINPYAFGALVLGSALGAGLGESKEYGGEYGKITLFSDMAYDTATAAVNAIPVAGLLISGFMALNKGITNLFGSTDGMTVLDAIVGSPLAGLLTGIGAPLKWINMWGSSKTGTFKNQSLENTQRTNAFMQNAFGDLLEKFDKAKKEAGKTYGTFSQRAARNAQANLDFADLAWNKILDMTDLNEYLNIRSLLMSSINNQRYAQDIQGGWNPLARGKLGMKIFNNATNHKIGMRLLSGAALVDSKQMILCGAID